MGLQQKNLTMFALTRKSLNERQATETELRAIAPELQTGDIILLRTRLYPLSWFIRYMSESYWNHTAIVLTTFESLPGYQAVLVAEALDDGIEIHRIQRFFNNSLYEVGVKRFSGLTAQDRDNITGYILSQVDAPYAWRRLSSALFAIIFGRLYRIFTYLDTHKFTCSNFVQKVFYFSLPPERQDEAIFLPQGRRRSLEIVRPVDIANSTNTEWIFNKH